RPHRADRVAAILDYHLGRAPERRNQLPHRVRRGAEQPASGRLHHAQAYSRCCAGLRTGRRRLRLLFPAPPGLPIWQFSPAGLGLPTQLGLPDWSPAQRGLSNWFPAQLGPRLTIWIGAATCIFVGSRLVITAGTARWLAEVHRQHRQPDAGLQLIEPSLFNIRRAVAFAPSRRL